MWSFKKKAAAAVAVVTVGAGALWMGSALASSADKPKMDPSDPKAALLPADGMVPLLDATGNLVRDESGRPVKVDIRRGLPTPPAEADSSTPAGPTLPIVEQVPAKGA